MQITKLFTTNGLFIDRDGDGLPDGCRYQIHIDPRLTACEKVATANLAVRLGIELVAYDQSLFYVYDRSLPLEPTPSLLIIHGRNPLAVWHRHDEGLLWIHNPQQITISGGRGLAELITWLACGYPRLGGLKTPTLDGLLSSKAICAGDVVGLAVSRGRLQAIYSQIDGVTKRLSIRQPLWPATPETKGEGELPQQEQHPDLVGLFEGIPHDADDYCPIPIVVDDPSDTGSVLAACHLGLRLGLGHTSVRLPLVRDQKPSRDAWCLYIKVHKDGQGARLEQDDRVGITLTGDSESLEMAARYLADAWPHRLTSADRPDPLHQWIGLLNELALMRSDLAEAAWLLGNAATRGQEEITAIRAHGPLSEHIRRYLVDRQSQPIRVDDLIEHDLDETCEFTVPWEVDELRQAVRDSLAPLLDTWRERSATLQAFISEPLEVRQSVADELRDWLDQSGATKIAVQVISSYKPGLSWMAEVVIPELVRLIDSGVDIRQVRICYERFDQNGYLELPSRWLQELYPIDELITQKTGLALDAIEFIAMDEPDPRYRVQALGDRTMIQEWSLTCHNGDRLYLDRFPDSGRVKTFTSWVALVEGSSTLWVKSFPSDLELIWERYQTEVLPWVEARFAAEGLLQPEKQPFFRELSIELWASEDDCELGVREERLSPLEGMHEEFYFTTLEWFARLGSELCGVPLRKPGAIIPWMRSRTGHGASLRVTMRRERPRKTELILISGERVAPVIDANHPAFKVRRLDFTPQERSLSITPVFSTRANNELKTIFDGLQVMVEKGMVELPENTGGARVSLYNDNGAVAEYAFPSTQAARPLSQTSPLISVPMEVIGYEQMQQQIQVLRTHGIGRVSTVARSFGGRDIEMVELVSPTADVVSRAKLAAAKPTYLILARHHANEVSSSNAALLLARELTQEKRALLTGVNVVIIPMENPDGAALHSRLAAEAPTWKHHAARFNALGEDLAAGYFQDHPSDPASKALTIAWQAWRPDVVGDNHGVPSHEWEQPFSGYVCPWFSTFWMPRAFYYGYFTYLDDPAWPEHRRMAKALRWEVSGRLAENKALVELNTIWSDRYLKYAHRPCPEKFLYDKAEFCQGLLTYCSGVNRESKAVTAARRYPDQTVLWWIDEVNDETAHGDYLALCVQAHLDANLAVIDYLASLPPQRKREQRYGRRAAEFKWSRPRPLDVRVGPK